jgi:hypothetical protein
MISFRPVMLTTALLVFGATMSPCQAALIFNFSYGFPGAPSVSASGTITTVDTPIGGGYEVTGISGFRTVTIPASGVDPEMVFTQPITSLLPVGYYGASNLIYPGGPEFLDGGGISFFAGEDINVYFSSGNGYTEYPDRFGYGDFTLSAIAPDPPSNVPEPRTAFLLGSGLILLLASRGLRSRKRS